MANNLEDLTAAAKLKLEAQKKSELNDSEDIYASIRDEVAEAITYPTIKANPEDFNIKYSQDTIDEDYDEIDEEEDSIYPGGPSEAQVDIWKKQYGVKKVMHVKIIERDFVFRTLNRYEYKQIIAMENVDALQREEIICNQVVLWPVGYNFKSMGQDDSGYPSTLSQVIMESSGFTKEYGIEVL